MLAMRVIPYLTQQFCLRIKGDFFTTTLIAPSGRGGVEDTTFEAKDPKKIRGQGQGPTSRGQTLSRPWTEKLEAKAQGHKAQVFSEKKVPKTIFQVISKKKKGVWARRRRFFAKNQPF